MSLEEERACTKCGVLKPPEDYYWNDVAHTKRRSSCKECTKRAVHARVQAERTPCTGCGVLCTLKALFCKRCARRGARSGRYKTGKRLDLNGYVVLSGYQDHPNSFKSGRIFEHKAVMIEHLGRSLLPGENIHHRNGVRTDNRIENLELWSKQQPSGQRISDKIRFAQEILAIYGEDPSIYE